MGGEGSSVGGGRRRVSGGGREGGVKERGRVKARGRPNWRRVEVESWIDGELDRRQAGSVVTAGWLRWL